MSLDVDFVRRCFPALASETDDAWALFDNAGGSVPARHVVDRVHEYMTTRQVQLGASYAVSRRARDSFDAGRAAAARVLGADPESVVLGSSSTALASHLAKALASNWERGDEIVVTDLDHETNIGPWRRLEERGIAIREWSFRPDTQRLELDDLRPLLNERTRLVAFTHCANVVGAIHDVPAITTAIREAGALSCVDGVAYAPHRRVAVHELGADFYLASLYKVFGPHVGALYGRREALLAARGPNHFFVGEDEVPYKFEPGSVPHELVAGLVGISEYLDAVAEHHDLQGDEDERTRAAYALFTQHEAELVEPLLAFLGGRERVRVLGVPEADPVRRVATVAFTIEGVSADRIPELLDPRRVAIRYGHFYAYRAMKRLGLLECEGIVRASLLHYNSAAEVQRLIEGLESAFDTLGV